MHKKREGDALPQHNSGLKILQHILLSIVTFMLASGKVVLREDVGRFFIEDSCQSGLPVKM